MKHEIPEYFSQESARLIYRKLTAADVSDWKAFFEHNDRLHYLGIDVSANVDELSESWISKQLERYETEGLGHLAAIEKQSGQLIGMAGILERSLDGELCYEIAYSLKPAYWKNGFGTEMANQMRLFGSEYKIAPVFISIIDKRNSDSIRVALKNKMSMQKETVFLGMEVYIFGTEMN